MKTLNKFWDWFTAEKISSIMNLAVLFFVLLSTGLWVRELGESYTITRTIGDLITTNLIVMVFWLSGCMFGMVLNSNKKIDQE